MKRLFEHWPEISARIRSAGSIAVFLDFDGTLAPIQTTPAEVRLSAPMRLAIGRLAANKRTRVWIISGRKRDDVREKTGLHRIRYLGVHGWETGFPVALDPEIQRQLDSARRGLETGIENLPGVWIEDKGPALAIHYRQAGESDSAIARALVREQMVHLNGAFRLMSGKKVWEILSREVGDKGSAIRRELGRRDHRALAVYVGDDSTDEQAFAALPDGVTVRVGRGSALTRAQFQVRNPADVRLFLEKLSAEIS